MEVCRTEVSLIMESIENSLIACLDCRKPNKTKYQIPSQRHIRTFAVLSLIGKNCFLLHCEGTQTRYEWFTKNAVCC
jgi:hypothetical protein